MKKKNFKKFIISILVIGALNFLWIFYNTAFSTDTVIFDYSVPVFDCSEYFPLKFEVRSTTGVLADAYNAGTNDSIVYALVDMAGDTSVARTLFGGGASLSDQDGIYLDSIAVPDVKGVYYAYIKWWRSINDSDMVVIPFYADSLFDTANLDTSFATSGGGYGKRLFSPNNDADTVWYYDENDNIIMIKIWFHVGGSPNGEPDSIKQIRNP